MASDTASEPRRTLKTPRPLPRRGRSIERPARDVRATRRTDDLSRSDPRGDAGCPPPHRLQRQLRPPPDPAQQVPEGHVVRAVEVRRAYPFLPSPASCESNRARARVFKIGNGVGVCRGCANAARAGREAFVRKVPIRRVQEAGGQDERAAGGQGRREEQLSPRDDERASERPRGRMDVYI